MPTTPTIDTPLALQEAFAARFNARDLDGLLDLAEPSGPRSAELYVAELVAA